MTQKEAYDIVDKLIDYYIENIKPEHPNEEFDDVDWDEVGRQLYKAVHSKKKTVARHEDDSAWECPPGIDPDKFYGNFD